MVSLRGYKRVQTTDKVFRVLDMVMEDKDKDIKKAVSWILREITKTNPKEVFEFLTKWAKSKPENKNTQWIIKDGVKKLPKNLQTILLKSL